MRAIPASGRVSDLASDYRLNDGACYLKLCPRAELRPRSVGIVKGMYLPLEYWDLLFALGAATGPQGRAAVTFDNTPPCDVRHVHGPSAGRVDWAARRLDRLP